MTLALHKLEGLTEMTVTDIRGFGCTHAKGTGELVPDDVTDFIRKARVNIVGDDSLAVTIIEKIRQNAHTGTHGDGKIYKLDISVPFGSVRRKGELKPQSSCLKENRMHDHDSHHHSYGAHNWGKAFVTGMALNTTFVIVEAIYGLAANSSALIADADHNPGDVLNLIFPWAAVLKRRELLTAYLSILR